jgi:DNA excision repair protein ERCC-2
MQKLGDPSATSEPSFEPSDTDVELNLFPTKPSVILKEQDGVSTSPQFPDNLIEPLETALDEAEKWLVQNQPTDFREALLGLYFRMHSFRRTAEIYDERFVTIIETESAVKVRQFCLDPSLLLRKALARGKAAVFFSATLTPIDYYRTLLGGEPEDPVLQLSSPFPPENQAVLIQDRIQTNFKGRAESLNDVVEAIGTLVQGRSGNYLVYFPSFQYLNHTLQAFQLRNPAAPVMVQRPSMSEPERDAFLAAFSVEHGETLVGFAVLGGIFGEGIDLVGERLIGAVIVGVGLPQLCAERNLIRDYFQQQNSLGFEYAYTFPGMNRVLQAIGRVIRSETDRGVVLLIDARFNETRYRRLFPTWWNYSRVRHTEGLQQAVRSFWEHHS